MLFFRRLREEAEKAEEPVESYTSTTVIRKTVETYDDSSNHQETSEVVMETTAVVTEDYPVEVGLACSLSLRMISFRFETNGTKSKGKLRNYFMIFELRLSVHISHPVVRR